MGAPGIPHLREPGESQKPPRLDQKPKSIQGEVSGNWWRGWGEHRLCFEKHRSEKEGLRVHVGRLAQGMEGLAWKGRGSGPEGALWPQGQAAPWEPEAPEPWCHWEGRTLKDGRRRGSTEIPVSALAEQSIIPIRQGCRFDPWSGHIRESTNECISEFNNESVLLSLPL